MLPGARVRMHFDNHNTKHHGDSVAVRRYDRHLQSSDGAFREQRRSVDANLVITGSSTFQMVQAPGMQNVEVRLHGCLAKRLTSDGVGGFSGTVNTLVR
jgi:hypothetical protein